MILLEKIAQKSKGMPVESEKWTARKPGTEGESAGGGIVWISLYHWSCSPRLLRKGASENSRKCQQNREGGREKEAER